MVIIEKSTDISQKCENEAITWAITSSSQLISKENERNVSKNICTQCFLQYCLQQLRYGIYWAANLYKQCGMLYHKKAWSPIIYNTMDKTQVLHGKWNKQILNIFIFM